MTRVATSTLVLSALLLACSSSSEAPAPTQAAAKPAGQAASPAGQAALSKFAPNDTVVDHEVKMLDGSDVKLADYRGKALLVVNTASQCGYTPQYADLQKVYSQYKDKGLEVLAFPSNDFGSQEPGSNDEIRDFVDEEFSISFPMFDKVHAKGPEKSPLYKTLTEQTGDGIKGEVQWNFTKFLVDPEGKIVARFDSGIEPTAPEVIAAIEAVLPSNGA